MPAARLKICAVSGSRADYGLLHWVLRAIDECPELELQLVVSGMHLSPEFGLTVQEIESGGLPIARRVEMLLSGDSGQAIGKSMGIGVIGFADAYASLAPDLVLVLGDRFETFAAVAAAAPARIPVAHIAGGDLTEGAIDDALRHAITKMSHLHFVTNADARKRVLQLGEAPDRVHLVGSPGVDAIRRLAPMSRAELERDLGVRFGRRNLLVTFHPATLEPGSAEPQFKELLAALERLGDDTGVVITYPNADNEGRALIPLIGALEARRSNVRAFRSLGSRRYLSLMRIADVVVGNSSSALYEAPALKKPAVNIGERQKGRLLAASVVSCAPRSADILDAIERALALDCSAVANPYGDGHSAERIVAILRALPAPASLLVKRFAVPGPQ